MFISVQGVEGTIVGSYGFEEGIFGETVPDKVDVLFGHVGLLLFVFLKGVC